MSEASQTWSQMISGNTRSVTSLQGSGDGPSRSSSRGRRTSNAGRDRARASRSPRRGRTAARKTRGTCGRSSAASSQSADLSLSLVSRLRRRLPTDGSTLFRQTWRRKATRAGRWLWEHTASALPTSGSDSTGEASWGTPCARGDNHHPSQRAEQGDTGWLSDQARLASWVTPTTADKLGRFGEDQAKMAYWPTPTVYNTDRTPEEHEAKSRELVVSGTRALGMPLPVAAKLTSWPTPVARDALYTAAHVKGDRMDSLIRCAVGSGRAATGSPAATEKPGQLNPEHSRWLMGFPAGWSCSRATATRSSRRSRRSSSRR